MEWNEPLFVVWFYLVVPVNKKPASDDPGGEAVLWGLPADEAAAAEGGNRRRTWSCSHREEAKGRKATDWVSSLWINMGECEPAELQSGDSRQWLQMMWTVAVCFVWRYFKVSWPLHLLDIPSWKPSAVMWISKQSPVSLSTWWVNYSLMTLRWRDKQTDQTNFHCPTDLVNNSDLSLLSSKGQSAEALKTHLWLILLLVVLVVAVVAVAPAVVLVRRRRGNYIIQKTF